MNKWANALLNKFKNLIEKQVPAGELTDENYVVYFRQTFIAVSSVLGFFLVTLSLYTQKDAGILNILGLILTDIILVINFILVKKQREKTAGYLLAFGLLASFTLGIFDDYHFLSKGYIWFLITPFVMFAIMEIKDFLKFLIVNIIVFVILQLYFYPKAHEVLPLQNNINAIEYWNFNIIEYITAFFTVLIMITTFWYVNNFLKERFKRYREKFAQTAKLTALGEMAGNIGHEINNPLAIIKVSSDSLRRNIEKETIDKERLLDSIEVIDGTIIRISKIINSLKMISRQEDTDKEKLNPCDIIENVIPISNMSIHNDSVEFQKELTFKEEVLGSSVQLSQITLNLLNNALFAVKDLKQPVIKVKCFKRIDLCVIQE